MARPPLEQANARIESMLRYAEVRGLLKDARGITSDATVPDTYVIIRRGDPKRKEQVTLRWSEIKEECLELARQDTPQ